MSPSSDLLRGSTPHSETADSLKRRKAPVKTTRCVTTQKPNTKDSCTELQLLTSSPDIVRVNKPRRLTWTGHVACMEARRGAYRVLVGKPEGRRPLGRPRSRREGNIKTNPRKMGRHAWTRSIWLRIRAGWWTVVNAVMNLRVPYNAGNFLSSWGPVSFWGRNMLHGVKFKNWCNISQKTLCIYYKAYSDNVLGK
jgi:hypothetical protein